MTTLACFAFVLLVLIYYTVDVKKWWSGAPFYYPGEHFHHTHSTRLILKQLHPVRLKWTLLRVWRMSKPEFCFWLCVLIFRHELHPGVHGPWSVQGVLSFPLAHGRQPIAHGAPHPEPCSHILLGPHLLHTLQKEGFLENLMDKTPKWCTANADIVYLRVAGDMI